MKSLLNLLLAFCFSLSLMANENVKVSYPKGQHTICKTVQSDLTANEICNTDNVSVKVLTPLIDHGLNICLTITGEITKQGRIYFEPYRLCDIEKINYNYKVNVYANTVNTNRIRYLNNSLYALSVNKIYHNKTT